MVELELQEKKALFLAQKDEISSYYVYKKLATIVKNPQNSRVLNEIAEEEKKHYTYLKELTKKEVKVNRLKIAIYICILRFFGLTFGIRLMERGEAAAQLLYSDIAKKYPKIGLILREEEKHENHLIEMLDEEMLEYVGSVVLGLSDALVELTGALAGFTLALQNAQLIAVIGFITGISAALSMGASEYLSTSEEKEHSKSPTKAAIYTGSTYLFTVIILITPFLIIENNANISLFFSLLLAVIIILIFTYYISVAKSLPFKQRFTKITGISLGVATISLIIGILVKIVFKIDL